MSGSGLESNKFAAAILVAGIIAMVTGFVTDALYKPEYHPKKRGYEISGAQEEATTAGAVVEEAAPVDIAALMAKASSAEGKAQFQKCAACHTVEKGGANKVGPNLWNVVEAAKGHRSDYTYSEAMKTKGGKWDYESLYHFLNNPKKFIPGTKMGFAGFKKPEDVANMISYLRENADSPAPLPK